MDRRTVVVGLASLGGSAALLLSGCGARTADRDADASGGRDADLQGDERLVTVALADELLAVETIELTRRRHPRLAAATRSALATHQAHARLLRGTNAGGPLPRQRAQRDRVAVPARAQEALAALVRAEARLSADHVATAMEARSGALARVVASMAAASAQLEQVLAQTSPGRSGSGSGGGG